MPDVKWYSGGGDIEINSTTITGGTANRLLRNDGTRVQNSLLSDDGTDVTMSSGQILGTSGGVAATAAQFAHAGDANSGFGFLGADIAGIAAAGAWQMRVESGKFGFRTASPLVFRSGGNLDTDVVGVMDNAAGVLEVNNGTGGTFRDLITRSISLNSATVSSDSPGITVGSGTGLTVNYAADVRRVVHKVTVTYAALAAAGLTADKTIATLRAGTRLVGIVADTTTVYSGGGVTAATLIVGKSVGGNEYIVSHDVLTAAITRGNADADLGTSINRANAVQGGDLPSWTATTAVSVRLTTVTANTDQLTQGSTTYYLTTEIK